MLWINAILAVFGQVTLFLVFTRRFWQTVDKTPGWHWFFLLMPVVFAVSALYQLSQTPVDDSLAKGLGVACSLSWVTAVGGTLWTYARHRYRST